ncbi:hypothetical protein R1flu_010679 [Riccia fluitans]|uniref:Uncharacterized protein n=1 Tax=Riccia fluitans TaxID=41844 RepID=A0ABD1Z5P4_9MARC
MSSINDVTIEDIDNDVLIEDIMKVINDFCLKLVEVTEKSILVQLRKDAKEGRELDMNSKDVIEQYVFTLEPLIDEAKASALKAAGAVLQSLHKAVSQVKRWKEGGGGGEESELRRYCH